MILGPMNYQHHLGVLVKDCVWGHTYVFVTEDVPGIRVEDCNRHGRGVCGARLTLVSLEHRR